MTIQVTPRGSYGVQLNGITWLQSAPTFFNGNGSKFSTEDGSLNHTQGQVTYNGCDDIGPFFAHSFQFSADSGLLNATIKSYNDEGYIVFSQVTFMQSRD